jgi:hypothetical protein
MGGDGATGESRGIYIKDASPTITNNYSIHGGSGGDSIGIIVSGTLTDQATPEIRDNNFSDSCITGGGGSETGKSVGIEYRAYSGGSLEGNKITAAVNATSKYTYGIYVTGTGTDPVIHRNIIRGEQTADLNLNWSRGIYLFNCPEPVEIYNNLIFTENIRTANSVTVDNSDAVVRNNTMYCSSTNSTSWVINIANPDAQNDITFQNNVVLAAAGTGIVSQGNISVVSSYIIERNNFYGMSGAYYDEWNMQNWTTVAEMNTNIDACSDNITNNAGFSPTTGRSGTTSPWVEPFASAGFDGAGASPAWGFLTDFDGVTRTGNGTTGWSMGAYEYDAP